MGITSILIKDKQGTDRLLNEERSDLSLRRDAGKGK